MSQKFHINAKGVPAPCRAKEGNCPYGGESGSDNHFDTLAAAQEAADEINEANPSYGGILPGTPSDTKTLTDKEVASTGKYLVSLIDKRKNSVKKPDIPGGSSAIYSIDDLETLQHTRGEFITSDEHDPVKNVQSMFDHVAGKSGKLYRYEDEGNYLETHDYDFEGTISNHASFLRSDYYLGDEDYVEEYKDDFGSTPEEAFAQEVDKHRELHHYSQNLAIEYGKDFEKKVADNPDYTQEDRDKIQGEYRKALADKLGAFDYNYGRD